MRILFLDDEIERHLAFADNNKEHDLHQVTLPYRAIEELKDFRFDEVWLDRDLGIVELSNQPTIKSRFIEITGESVVDWIVENKNPEDIPKIVIHSWNAIRSDWMTKRLQDFGFNVIKVPFNMNKTEKEKT